ncbi:Chromosome partition protein Smc [Hartmannibacter diazotrophicus]|uniref:Chromosome partition protein Smc n=1 Tax=Hartmannibacter diazotrophicus TaxID=1482074 RepID=A0A2C9D3E2_9HYPH|nr:AAA family ATPase [Hartmannibacter diazotrophicus]SON54678.1 Chromosome partition protein Smc [Hartmannibacter diazotrophicus]
MQFEKLRLVGFKSFVEPTEFLIEPGLTGVVGPNGCGKSNLVEALRWVMGENSYKNMRASGMDDVIFSGSTHRPARNSAEVTLLLANTEREAPAAFNDADRLEVTRRIEREAGSVYRINSREVRARDVQLLFADASTGSRSPSMVRQGQIGELIAARPSARRQILEEAAGISGLHSRRHEAELRLKAAEQNLDRLEDVLSEIDVRLDALKRQSRQASRYRTLSREIRKEEAALAYLRWRASSAACEEADAALAEVVLALADAQTAQAEAARIEAIAAHALPQAREKAAAAGAALQRLQAALGESEAEEKRVRSRIEDLARRGEEAERDLAREQSLVEDNDQRLGDLARAMAEIVAEGEGDAARLAEASGARDDAADLLAEAEFELDRITQEHAQAEAQREALERSVRDAAGRTARLGDELTCTDHDLDDLERRMAAQAPLVQAADAAEAAEIALSDAEKRGDAAEAAIEAAANGERAARQQLGEAERELGRLDTEARTLARILNVEMGQLFPPLVDQVTAKRGYETALGAALGDDMEAPVDERAPAHWSVPGPGDDDPPLPDGVSPLSAYVKAPDALIRCLAQIGVVDRSEGEDMRMRLKPGQRLVSREGDLWRWDGYVAGAEAPTPAAQRLESRNRLAELDARAADLRKRVAIERGNVASAQAKSQEAREEEKAAREAVRAANRALGEAKDRKAAAERAASELAMRRESLAQQRERLDQQLAEALDAAADAERRLAALPDHSALVTALSAIRARAAERRAELAEARSAVDGLEREAALRKRRLADLEDEKAGWERRFAEARRQMAVLEERSIAIAAEREALAERPGQLVAARGKLIFQIDEARATSVAAADALARAETEASAADKAARQALVAFGEVREGKARAEERVAAARMRREDLEAEITEHFEAQPAALAAIAEIRTDAPLPRIDGIESRLDRLRQERERLGGVNLQAETEAGEVEERRTALLSERDDLIEAIRRLRGAIQNLNREARERLLSSFNVVNEHFQRLFKHLFGGGTAELQLVDSDDPLDAGLEILARPPGKKPQTMTLLSGGEQALTAMALIFAVFLTNPAPICVLDEVDAPLDDANVERYCDLLDEMVRGTSTRFLVITHNPITMARMRRLFGVTMSERGVSQLVSVDLETAGRFLEAV